MDKIGDGPFALAYFESPVECTICVQKGQATSEIARRSDASVTCDSRIL